MDEPVRNPFKKRAIKISIILAAGIALLAQPWVLFLRLIGIVAAINCIPLIATQFSYARKWKEMLERPLLRLDDATVFDGGVMKDAEMHFLRMAGCRVEACAYQDGVFTLAYSFGRKKERSEVSLALDVPPHQEQDALAAVEAFHKMM